MIPPKLPLQFPTVSTHATEEIVEATEELFMEIAGLANNDTLREAILTINTQMRAIRPYEAAFIPDREIELQALSDSWAKRDIPELKRLIVAYFQRRQDLAPQIVNLINNPN